jgi:hypothetical protein
MQFLGGKGAYFEKLAYGSETLDMTSEGLGEVFKDDSADTYAVKFPLVSMGGRANGQACADGERGPPSARAELLLCYLHIISSKQLHTCLDKYNYPIISEPHL